MTNQDSVEFARLCTLLSQTYDKSFTEELQDIYFECLKEFSIEQVRAAVNQAIASRKFFPKPAELRELLEGSAEDRAALAWAVFLDAAADGGRASVRFADPAMAHAVDAVFGGWVQACRLLHAGWAPDANNDYTSGGCSDEMAAHYQKSFLRQYVAAQGRAVNVEMYRPGLSELSMRENGATWADRMPLVEQPVIFIGPQKCVAVRLTFDVKRGCLTEPSRSAVESGLETAQYLAEARRPQIAVGAELRAALPPAPENEITDEELAEMKAKVLNFQAKRM